MSKIYCFVGPSGSGKTTLANYCTSIGIKEIVSSTSRKARNNEVEGKDYYFVDKSDFNTDDYIEYSEYAGMLHGLKKEEVETKLSQYQELCVVLDLNGVQALKKLYPKQVVSIALVIDIDTSIDRMKKRGDSQESIQRRIENYYERKEYLLKEHCDYWIDANQEIKDVFQSFNHIRNLCQAKGNSV